MEPHEPSLGIHSMFNRLRSRRQLDSRLPGRRCDRNRGLLSGRERIRESMAGGRHFGLEWLEPRQLLAGSSSPIAAVQPYNGQQLSQSPQQLVITFNSLNVAAFMGTLDVQIEELNRDGTTTPIWTGDDAPLEETDANLSDLVIPLQKFDPGDFAYDNLTLSAGKYEIELVGGTGLTGAASGAFGPGPQLFDPNQPYKIGEFTVLGGGATISTATPLGTIGSAVQTIGGSLDPNQPDSAVDLYQFTLPQGHLWQVGVAISAHSIGSPLLASLSLLDSSGNVLATRDSGTLLSNPDDPYLFVGLKGGTYYVGVSGEGNLVGQPGGYDPVLGIPGSAGIAQPGGPFPFALGLVASAHDQPIRLVNFTLDRADLHDSSPTGFSLTFSGPIDLSNLFQPDAQENAIEVVDSSGQVWPISAEEYQVSDARLSLIFDRPLPAGSYTLMVAPGAGLNDLAGQSIHAPGQPAGVLANWIVAPQSVPLGANDLGVLWPLSTNLISPESAGAFHETAVLVPGQEIDYSFTTIVPGFFKLQTQFQSGEVGVLIAGNGVTTVLDLGTTRPLNEYLMQLNAGAYTLRFENLGSHAVAVDWLLKIASLDFEKIVGNGVGQSSALDLSLFSQTSGSGNSSLASFLTVPGATVDGIFGGSIGPIPASLMVTLNTGLIGQPTLGGQTVATVGPTVETGSTALADNGTGLGEAIQFVRALDSSRWLAGDDRLTDAEPAAPKAVPNDPAVAAASLGALARLDPEAGSVRADERALGQAEWLVRLGASMQSWLSPGTAVQKAEQLAVGPPAAHGLAQDDAVRKEREPDGSRRSKRSISAAQVDLTATACVVMIGALACRVHRPLLKWWRRTGQLTLAGEKLARPLLHRGPHAASARARATTKVRKPHALR